MEGTKQFKQALLDSLLLGLPKRGAASTTEVLGFHERKRAIRLAADAALVNARGADATRWTRTMRGVTELAHRRGEITVTPAAKLSSKMICERVLRRTRRSYRRWGPRKAGSASGSAGVLARATVRKRTRVLKGIVPGGEELDDESTLLGETLDYAVCLKAQVDVMQLLVRVLQAAKP